MDYRYIDHGEVVESIERKHTKDINRELTELLGLCWHDYQEKSHEEWNVMVCQKCGIETNGLEAQFQKYWNPNFTTDSGKIELLRLMMKRENADDCIQTQDFLETIGKSGILNIEDMVRVDLILDTTGLLAQTAVEFLRREV
jgi:50S ribosomal subunit-associated GTPase HflX